MPRPTFGPLRLSLTDGKAEIRRGLCQVLCNSPSSLPVLGDAEGLLNEKRSGLRRNSYDGLPRPPTELSG